MRESDSPKKSQVTLGTLSGDAQRHGTGPVLLDRISATWRANEWIAYREDGLLVTGKYASVSAAGDVNIGLHDGAIRAAPVESIALDWFPEAAEMFEERAHEPRPAVG